MGTLKELLSLEKRNGIVIANALERGDLEVALDLLHRSKCDVNQRSNGGQIPLFMAISRKDKNLIQLILEKGASPNMRDAEENTALHIAMQNDDTELEQLLLKKGAYPNAQDAKGNTALHIAAQNNDTELAKLLLEKGADPNMRDAKGNTPLHIAALSPVSLELVQLLLKKHIKDYDEPLLLAARHSCENTVKALLEKGANPNAREGENGYTALHFAIFSGSEEKVKALLEKGADPNGEGQEYDRPLHSAARTSNANNANMVRLLLAKGADPNIHGACNHTPLHHAAGKGDLEMIQVLLDNGADPNARNMAQLPPEHMDIKKGSEKAARDLLASFGTYNSLGERTVEGPWTERQQESYDKEVAWRYGRNG